MDSEWAIRRKCPSVVISTSYHTPSESCGKWGGLVEKGRIRHRNARRVATLAYLGRTIATEDLEERCCGRRSRSQLVQKERKFCGLRVRESLTCFPCVTAGEAVATRACSTENKSDMHEQLKSLAVCASGGGGHACVTAGEAVATRACSTETEARCGSSSSGAVRPQIWRGRLSMHSSPNRRNHYSISSYCFA